MSIFNKREYHITEKGGDGSQISRDSQLTKVTIIYRLIKYNLSRF